MVKWINKKKLLNHSIEWGKASYTTIYMGESFQD